VGEAIGRIVKTILDALTPIITPDWGGLVGMLPIFLVLGVVGPILSLLILGWVIYVLRAPRARIPYVEPAPVPAQIVNGQPVYPSGEPYCAFDQLVFPPGSTTCTVDGRDLAVICPKCGVGRAAYIDTCGNCGLVLQIKPKAGALRPAGPPPGGAAAA